MIHLKKFNEEVENPKLLEFYNEYKNLFKGEYDSGDLYDTVGDLCVQHSMTQQEVKQVLDTFDCSFDVDKLLQATYDNWVDEIDEIGYSGRNQNGFTIADLRKMIEGLDGNTPVLLVNPVGRGSNQDVADYISIDDVIISDDGIAYTTNMSHIKHSVKTKGLLIYEG